MGRNPINNRLHTLRDFVSLTVCGTIVCMLTVSIGCSKLGSQQRLDQRNFPFNNSTAQSAIETPLERASKHRQLRRDQQANHVPNNPVREEVRDVQTITKRPPKLSTMPKMTLYAEPTVCLLYTSPSPRD